MTPVQRTRAVLKAAGVTSAIVEHYNMHARIRQDLFGFIDIVALRDGNIVGIQVTGAGDFAAHITKIRAEPRHIAWLQCGGIIEVWGWRKVGKTGKRKLWKRRVATLTDGNVSEWKEE